MRPSILSRLVLLPLFVTSAAVGLGSLCIWDSDTLADEVRGLPQAQDLVTGRWFRHGKAYYQRRIDTIPALLDKEPRRFELYDDLAVAHEMLRDRDAAIAVMRKKGKVLDLALGAERFQQAPIEPYYRYYANLGTFYAHKGEFEKAIVELEKAVKINPKAHFGRERFQIDLIRYVAACKKDRRLWTEHNYFTYNNRQSKERRFNSITGLTSFTAKFRSDEETKVSPWKEMFTATAGMLRFGGLEGAELYRSLGDLFLSYRDLNLAWWSYQIAITKSHPAEARIRVVCKGIEKHWKQAAPRNRRGFKPPTQALFQKVQQNSFKWLITFQDLERTYLKAGKDPSQKVVLAEILAKADAAVPRILPLVRSGEGKRGGNRAKDAEPPVGGAHGLDHRKGEVTPKRQALEKKDKSH